MGEDLIINGDQCIPQDKRCTELIYACSTRSATTAEERELRAERKTKPQGRRSGMSRTRGTTRRDAALAHLRRGMKQLKSTPVLRNGQIFAGLVAHP